MKAKKRRKRVNLSALKSRKLMAKAILDIHKRVESIEAERKSRTIRGFDTDCVAYAESEEYRDIEDIAYEGDGIIG